MKPKTPTKQSDTSSPVKSTRGTPRKPDRSTPTKPRTPSKIGTPNKLVARVLKVSPPGKDCSKPKEKAQEKNIDDEPMEVEDSVDESGLTEAMILKAAKSNSLGKINELELCDRELTSLPVHLFNQMKGLEDLNLSGNKLTAIPDNLRLPNLTAWDLTGNMLTDTHFAKNFPKLEELYLSGNKDLSISDRYIAAALCPSLTQIDNVSGCLEKHVEGFRSRLEPQVTAYWDGKFSSLYDQTSDTNEKEKIVESFITFLNEKAKFDHCGPNLKKYQKFMAENIGRALVKNLNSSGPTPQKRKRLQAEKVKYTDTDESPEKSLKTKKSLDRDIKNGEEKKRFTIVKERFSSIETLPEVCDLDPVTFLRCHASDNDPTDRQTDVWSCAFQPNVQIPGGPSPIIATCGGNSICVIDCSTGLVMHKYKHPEEMFYTVAWTSLPLIDGKEEDTNILAAAGIQQDIKLILPDLKVCYCQLKGHTGSVNDLKFHPRKPELLFSCSADGQIIMWDIGKPVLPDYKTIYKILKKFTSAGQNLTSLVYIDAVPKLYLIAGGDTTGCFLAWTVDDKNPKAGCERSSYAPTYELYFPEMRNDEVIDGLAVIKDDIIASKCVGWGGIQVWSFKKTVHRQKHGGRCKIEPLMNLQWIQTSQDYMGISACNDLVACGDDKGSIWLYNMKTCLKKTKTGKQLMKPSMVVPWADCKLGEDKQDQLMKDIEVEPPTINNICMDPSGKYVVALTSNTLVCIWKVVS